jgi:hypothetical protein
MAGCSIGWSCYNAHLHGVVSSQAQLLIKLLSIELHPQCSLAIVSTRSCLVPSPEQLSQILFLSGTSGLVCSTS